VLVLDFPAGSPELRRRVGYMTQAPSVYADLTVRETSATALDRVTRRELALGAATLRRRSP